MPNIKSAKKRVNVIKRQSNENIPTRGSMRTAVKKAVKDVENKSLLIIMSNLLKFKNNKLIYLSTKKNNKLQRCFFKFFLIYLKWVMI